MNATRWIGTILSIATLGLILRNSGAFNALMATGGGLTAETIGLLGGGNPTTVAALGPPKTTAPQTTAPQPYQAGPSVLGIPNIQNIAAGSGAGGGAAYNPNVPYLYQGSSGGANTLLASLLATIPRLFQGSQTAYSQGGQPSANDWLNNFGISPYGTDMGGGSAGGVGGIDTSGYDPNSGQWV